MSVDQLGRGGSARTRHAAVLFAGIAAEYGWVGRLLSLGQEPGWRRALVRAVTAPAGSLVADVASGTGLVARAVATTHGIRVVQLDASESMIRAGLPVTRRAGLERRLAAAVGRAERLPFGDATFDALTFTYLLRYVDDAAATMAELARVVRPGGEVVGLEFHVPAGPVARIGWRGYVRWVMPMIAAAVSPAWGRTGRFLGPSIEGFYRRHPLADQARWWHDAGLGSVRYRTFLWGTAILIRGVRRGS